ncbi:MAG TPA: hypothetical protein VFV28_06425 [Limnobacter sp.]|nr:hypothetical protein [Limnobacter sp.]
MISSLFALLLVPVFPGLEESQYRHGPALAELERQLEAARTLQSPAGQEKGGMTASQRLTLPVPELPAITGRIFDWSENDQNMSLRREGQVEGIAETLRLTGVIEAGGQQVAILHDGREDHVVGLGSYVLNAYKVTALGRGKVELTPVIERAGVKRIQLNLVSGTAAGELQ